MDEDFGDPEDRSRGGASIDCEDLQNLEFS
jgi:hypothetical protein